MASASILAPQDYPLDPNSHPSANWQPGSVIVCTLTLDPTPSKALIYWPPKFDQNNSWINPIADPTTFSIATYASQICLGQTGNTGNTVNFTTSTEFAINGPCYILLMLDAFYSWQFQCAQQGVKMVLSPTGKYTKLWHVKADGTSVQPAQSTDDGCKMVYFEADVPIQNIPTYTQDFFNTYAEFVLGGGSYYRKKYDPDIKNTGRPPQVVGGGERERRSAAKS